MDGDSKMVLQRNAPLPPPSPEPPLTTRVPAGIKETSDANQGPTSYDNFIDAEGFDGGDGQVRRRAVRRRGRVDTLHRRTGAI